MEKDKCQNFVNNINIALTFIRGTIFPTARMCQNLRLKTLKTQFVTSYVLFPIFSHWFSDAAILSSVTSIFVIGVFNKTNLYAVIRDRQAWSRIFFQNETLLVIDRGHVLRFACIPDKEICEFVHVQPVHEITIYEISIINWQTKWNILGKRTFGFWREFTVSELS